MNVRSGYWRKKRAQHMLSRLSGDRLLVFEKHKHGLSDTADIVRHYQPVGVILDVGANTGQSAARFRAAFPAAQIISVEPVQHTYEQLQRNTAGLNIETCNLALGREPGQAEMYLTDYSLTSSFVKPDAGEIRGTEVVRVDTLDNFLSERTIDFVDILKIDAEGYDLEVLAGGQCSLGAGRVRSVLVEVGFQLRDERHPNLSDAQLMLSAYGFHLFGIYDQTLEWTGDPCLRFANALFCR